jgi:hypothetical protein
MVDVDHAKAAVSVHSTVPVAAGLVAQEPGEQS